MSDPSIPAPDDQHKPDTLRITIPPGKRPPPSAEELRVMMGDVMRMSRMGWTDASSPPFPPTPATITTNPIEHTLYSVRAFGFTHPSTGRYLMVPKEFQAILVRETKAVATVVWELMQQTIGWEGHGPGGRREWAPLTKRHFVRTGLLSRSQAEASLKRALEQGYIKRRRIGARRFEYAIRWKGTN
jgi:hypothetical protein